MHNLAIALKLKGYNVSGSDDMINDPSKSRLKKYHLLPEKEGWFSEKISKDISLVQEKGLDVDTISKNISASGIQTSLIKYSFNH